MSATSELSGGLLRLQAALDSMRETIRDHGDELGRVTAERDELKSAFLAGEFPPNRACPIITADELRPGMWVAHKLIGGSWATAKVRERSKFLDSEKFVLLEDAPEPEPETYTCPDCGNSVKRVEADA